MGYFDAPCEHIQRLSDITAEMGITVVACGCCDSPDVTCSLCQISVPYCNLPIKVELQEKNP